MAEACGTPQLVKAGISPKSMNVDLSVDSNVSELIHVLSFDIPIDSEAVLLHPSCPRLGDTNPFQPTKYATDIAPRPTSVPNVWEVAVSYDIMGAPPIEEGKAYDFATRAIVKEVVAQDAYQRQVYEVNRTTKALVPIGEPIQSYEIGGIPYTNTADDLFADPLMKPKADILVTFWMLANKKTADQVENGSIYKFIGQTNLFKLTLCGIPVNDYGLTIEDITPTKYRYYPKDSTTSEDRYKLNFEVRIDPTATGYGTGVLSTGRNAKLYPRGATTGTKVTREIWTSDIDPAAFPYQTKKDVQIDYDVLLNSKGEILNKDTENVCYIGYVQQEQFYEAYLSLPTTIGSYARP